MRDFQNSRKDIKMATYKMMGPSGPLETTAAGEAAAWNNLRARLHFECGLSWYDAGRYDHSDLKKTGERPSLRPTVAAFPIRTGKGTQVT